MNVLISGADRGLGFGMTKKLVEEGNTVFAGQYMKEWPELQKLKIQYPEKLHLIPMDVSNTENIEQISEAMKREEIILDMIISNGGINGKCKGEITMQSNYEHMLTTYNVNAVGAVRLVEMFWGLLEKSSIKRICFISSEAGSITQADRVDNFSYCMSKAALNMYAKLIYNRLHPDGYSIRLYHPGWIRSYMQGSLSDKGTLSIQEAAEYAVAYFMDNSPASENFFMQGYDGEHFAF